MTLRRTLAPGLDVFPLALGTNVFGWTADEATSHRILDDYVDAGGNFLDTADSYSFWVPGNVGGESEATIGRWLAKRDDRDRLVLATKVSQHPEFAGMRPDTIRRAADASLSRLGTDAIDLYYAHFDDASVPLVDSIGALSELIDAGKVRSIGVSNYSVERINEWLRICDAEGIARPVAIEPQYSLVERGIEESVLPLARENGIGVVPYYALARGFLTGKYSCGTSVDSPRSEAASAYLTPLGLRVLETLEAVAAAHDAPLASIALAWVAAQPGVVAPIASARNSEQLPALLRSVEISLRDDELNALEDASEPVFAPAH